MKINIIYGVNIMEKINIKLIKVLSLSFLFAILNLSIVAQVQELGPKKDEIKQIDVKSKSKYAVWMSFTANAGDWWQSRADTVPPENSGNTGHSNMAMGNEDTKFYVGLDANKNPSELTKNIQSGENRIVYNKPIPIEIKGDNKKVYRFTVTIRKDSNGVHALIEDAQ